mmetsp:Transcript_88821/g.247206  ORF Transcript_88821/g.247206 Transcript_88821/m.247206 type:complete len:216 (+) Transcript_88821:46-693(+)
MKSASVLLVALVGTAAVAAAVMPASMHPMEASARALQAACQSSSASQCQDQYRACIREAGTPDQTTMCQCYARLGNCLNNANCLNGTNENLANVYCRNGDSYCCSQHGEFEGCGENQFSRGVSSMCICEMGFTGTHCNASATATTCSADASCGACPKCCKNYKKETCEACIQAECHGTCSATPSKCTVCAGCCRSYLEGNQMDCNVCVEDECTHH